MCSIVVGRKIGLRNVYQVCLNHNLQLSNKQELYLVIADNSREGMFEPLSLYLSLENKSI